MADEPPQFLIVGGSAFDEAAALPDQARLDFLAALVALRRNPTSHSELEIDPARAWGGEENRYVARLGAVVIGYIVNQDFLPSVTLIDVLEQPDFDALLE